MISWWCRNIYYFQNYCFLTWGYSWQYIDVSAMNGISVHSSNQFSMVLLLLFLISFMDLKNFKLAMHSQGTYTLIHLQEIDLHTVKKEDLSFNAPFQLYCRRNDYIHALVAFFTVEFTHCHKRTGFSTGKSVSITLWNSHQRTSRACRKNLQLLETREKLGNLCFVNLCFVADWLRKPSHSLLFRTCCNYIFN